MPSSVSKKKTQDVPKSPAAPPAPPPSLVTLPPDLLAACLQNFPPAEISRVCLRLSKASRNCTVLEDTSLLAIKQIVKVAESWTKSQKDQLGDIDSDETDEVRRLVKDHPVFAGFKNVHHDDINTDGIHLIEGETWAMLYRLLYGVLKSVGNFMIRRVGRDDATVSLLVWMLFGYPNLKTANLPNEAFFSLDTMALVVSNELDRMTMFHQQEKFKSRAVQIALRLAHMGCDKGAVSILDQCIDGRIVLEAFSDLPFKVPSILPSFDPPSSAIDIDIVIHIVKFLVHAYSLVHIGIDSILDSPEEMNRRCMTATMELVEAVRLGRWAVAKAKERYSLFLETQVASVGVLGQGWVRIGHQKEQPQGENPTSSVSSLFWNDATRLANAQMHLMHAIVFLGERIGMGTTPVRSIGIFPRGYTAEERSRAIDAPSSPNAETMVVANQMMNSFFNEARVLHRDIHDVLDVQKTFVEEMQGGPFAPMRNGARDLFDLSLELQLCDGDMSFCVSRASHSLAIGRPVLESGQDPIFACVKIMRDAFDSFLTCIKRNGNQLQPSLSEIGIDITKGLGKALAFSTQLTGDEESEYGVYFDVAYVLASLHYGSGPMMVHAINQLDLRTDEVVGSATDRCSRAMAFLDGNLQDEAS